MFFAENPQSSQTPDSKPHEKNKLPQTQTKGQIVEHYNNVNELLEKMNKTIVRIFKCKEDELKGNIKKQIKDANLQVSNLTQLTSEDEVQRKLKFKRQEIEEQRQLILQSSMEFSNKCIEYKNSLNKVMTTTKDLMSEIQFLDSQINSARMTNQQLKKQLEATQNTVINQEYYTQEQTYRPPEISGVDIEGVNEQYTKSENELLRAKRFYENIDNIRNDGAFQENEIERIFLECVQKVKLHKQQNDIQKLTQSSKNPKKILKPIQSLKQIQRQTDDLNKQDFVFSDIELNDYHKRMIFDEFLSRNEIKALIYNLL